MNFKELAYRGIGLLNKANQHHQLPTCALEYIGHKKKNAVYAVHFSTDRKEHINTIKELSMKIDATSHILIKTDDVFIEKNLQYEFKGVKNVSINTNMAYDIPVGNPIFYERSSQAADSRTGSKLVYDDHIMNAVRQTSGKYKQNGPFITDTTWFQGGAKQGKFRKWLFGEEFGLKTIVILPAAEFDVDAGKTGLCMFIGEKGYNSDITVIDYVTKEEFTTDFRKIGYIITNKDLAVILPSIKTKTIYEWKRTAIDLKFSSDEGTVIEGPKEIKNGKVKVLKRLLLNAEPEYYYTSQKYVSDWTDSDQERFVTRYQPSTGRDRWQEIAVGTVVAPGVIVPGGMWFTYTVVKRGTGNKHKKHLMSKEITKILKATRTGKSLHTPQTVWVPYITEFSGFTNEQKQIINKL